ncbi:MAG: hypothetical protein ABSC94_18285 [Polyangiaceae bacterium]|jgi:serine/threonine protein phosphatase PrpC
MSAPFSYVRQVASNRQKSEDTAEVFERGDVLVVVLADGAGGIRDGARASGALVAAVRAAVEDAAFSIESVRQWAELFRITDKALAENRVGETTGVVVVASPRRLIGVSAGDSEAWVVTATQVADLTRAQRTKERVGSGRADPVVFERQPLSGALLVATDGLFEFASADVIAGLVRGSEIRVAAERLIELVRLPSGKLADDVALVLVSAKPPERAGEDNGAV